MATRASTGTCNSCGRSVAKSGMTRHLKSCMETDRTAADSAAPKGRRPRKVSSFHLVVEGRYQPEYWVHLQVPAKLRLLDFDNFLRETWLECCGHLSAFTIGSTTYFSDPVEDFDDQSMNVALGRILSQGRKFLYEYDFGSTTELAVRIISEGEMIGPDIRLMARNNAPVFPCCQCGTPATEICSECVWDDQGLLCDECTGKHGCDEGMLLPVVNSPRTGTCAYTGENFIEELGEELGRNP